MTFRIAFALQTLLLAFPSASAAEFNIYSDSLKQEGRALQVADKNTKPGEYAKKGFGVKKIVIDPGHGGHDPGCLGAHSFEKEIALGIAQKLAAYVAGTYPDVEVILTRNTDEFIPLNERAQIANRSLADLFISVHCNYISRASHVQGSETYVLGAHKMEENLQVALRENAAVLHEENYESIYGYDPNSPEAHIIMSMFQNAYLGRSILFAGKVEQHLVQSANRQSRGVKQAGFLVLRETAMPSVLIEAGFLSNSQEEKYLRSEEGQLQVAAAILSAFGDYKAEIEGTFAEKPTPVYTSTQTISATHTVQPLVAPPPPPPPPPALVASPAPTKGIVFKIQLAASSKFIDTQKGEWAALAYPIEIVTESGLNKYQIAAGGDLQEASRIRLDARAKGFPDAFIAAYQNGARISMDEAKKLLALE
ncbi:MAG: N-acetylmuramoyl-L-alanine amidase [Saprospirales bacterium]|nr:N-acetylmuramoyl-L-alanine amidase [Saprospirales bacterium]